MLIRGKSVVICMKLSEENNCKSFCSSKEEEEEMFISINSYFFSEK